MRTGSLIILAAVNGLVATGLSAIGAHALPASMPAGDKATFAMATDFHLFHALALLGIAALAGRFARIQALGVSALLFQAGILAFSGSLYVRTLLGPGSLGVFHWITPIGGLFLMAGWVMLCVAGYKARKEEG